MILRTGNHLEVKRKTRVYSDKDRCTFSLIRQEVASSVDGSLRCENKPDIQKAKRLLTLDGTFWQTQHESASGARRQIPGIK